MQAMLAHRYFEGIAAKAAQLRGRVIRFRKEAYNSFNEEQAADVDRAREQLEIISDTAIHVGNMKDETRIQRIQSAFGQISEALNSVLAVQHGTMQGE
jgi:hypothetical protein